MNDTGGAVENNVYTATQPGRQRRAGYMNTSRLPRDVCARCGKKGHWWSRCVESASLPQYTPMASGPGFVQGVTKNTRSSETYIEVFSRGRHIQALLDSGSEYSLCPLRLARNAKITPITVDFYAANGTKIPIVGMTRIFFNVDGGRRLSANVYITDAVDELIFGFDWLRDNKCEWLFSSSLIVVDGTSIPLHSRETGVSVRRIFVRESIVVPPDCSATVPVRLAYANLHTPQSDWLAEPKQIKPGLLAARSLLPNDDTYASVVLLNVSGTEQSVRCGHSLGVVSPCDTTDNQPNSDIIADGHQSNETIVKCATIGTMTNATPISMVRNDFRTCDQLLIACLRLCRMSNAVVQLN